MLTDIDKEFDTPEIDENGELIEVIEEDDVFIEEDTGLEEQPDSFYEAEDDIVQEGEEEEEFDNIQEVTVEAKENYDNAKEQLVAIFTSILEAGEITAEDNVEIEQVKEQYSVAYNDIKENTEVIQKKTLEERMQELADGMVGATTDDILNILTEDGTKCWLYKDDDGNVLMDGTAIPELTILLNKLNLIAKDGENEGEIKLTPNFINMVVKDTGAGNSVNKIVNKYYLSTSKTELIGGTWIDVLPTPSEQEDKFLWIKTVTTFLDKDKLPQDTIPICVSAQDGLNGKDGLNGADGADGKDGVSLTYKGEFTSHPYNPQNGWYYRNTTEGKTFVYQDNNWYQMTVDGQDGLNGNNGKDGLSIEYKGELSSPPSNPVKNWTYKDSDNGIVYIYTGSAWEVMTYDGSNGQDGADGQNGLSIFVTYNDSTTQPATPIGNGTTNGWHTNVTSSVVWMSQKVASSSTTGTWGVPIKIQGKDGQDGASVQEVITQYAKGTSTSIAPTIGWDSSMPPYQEGDYLWIRTRIKYSNNANYVYSTPICDQSWKANAEVYSQYKQLQNKFSWIVKSGTEESNMVLTDSLYSVLSNNITLKGKNIEITGDTKITGLVSANSNFKILADGSIEAKSMLSGSTAYGKSYVKLQDGNITIRDCSDGTVTTEFTLGQMRMSDGYNITYYAPGYIGSNNTMMIDCSVSVNGGIFATNNFVIATPGNALRGIDVDGKEIHLVHIDTNDSITFGYGSYSSANKSDTTKPAIYTGGSRFMGGKYASLMAKDKVNLCCEGGKEDSDTAGRIEYYKDGNDNYVFRPCYNGKVYNGTGSLRWYKVYSTSADDVSSDRELKENIKYIQSENLNKNAETLDNTEINYSNMYYFIKNDLDLTSYNYKGNDTNELGFIAQDIIVNKDGTDNLIGQVIVNPKDAVSSSTENEKCYLSYNTGNYAHVIAGALKQAILEIENLKTRIGELENANAS